MEIYCRRHHAPGAGALCPRCSDLLRYALERLERCPRRDAASGSCRKCPIHCYSPDYRDRIREVMRYVGPRMILWHPVMAIRHLINEIRK